jgi:RNase H-fold protein (predicted Holliday junction resolvase)
LDTYIDVDTIIVWLPYDLYGKDTRQLDKTQKFIEKLWDIFPKKTIIGHDERFSSFQASAWFDDHRDDIAAQCILQSYIDSKNK